MTLYYINGKLRLFVVIGESAWIQIAWHTDWERTKNSVCHMRFYNYASVRIWNIYQCVTLSGELYKNIQQILISLCLFKFWWEKTPTYPPYFYQIIIIHTLHTFTVCYMSDIKSHFQCHIIHILANTLCNLAQKCMLLSLSATFIWET